VPVFSSLSLFTPALVFRPHLDGLWLDDGISSPMSTLGLIVAGSGATLAACDRMGRWLDMYSQLAFAMRLQAQQALAGVVQDCGDVSGTYCLQSANIA